MVNLKDYRRKRYGNFFLSIIFFSGTYLYGTQIEKNAQEATQDDTENTRALTTITANTIKPTKTISKTTFTKSVRINQNLNTSGNTTVGKILTVSGATKLNGGLAMDTNKFIVANNTGNTTIGGTLNVAGITKLNGGLTMDTNKFVVANNTGNTTIAGTLGVTGATNLNGGLTMDTDKFVVEDSTGNTTIAGTLGVAGTLDVAGITTLAENTTINGTLKVTDQTNLDSTTYITQKAPTAMTSKSLASTEAQPVCVDISPTGDFVAVVYNTESPIDIFSVNATGNISSIISQTTGQAFRSVAWSPNWSASTGGFVAALGNNDIKIFAVDANGIIELSDVGHISTADSPLCVAWSPQGDYIAVTNGNADSVQIFSVNGSGALSSAISSQTTGSTPVSVAWAPTWSPETGGFIAVANSGNGTVQIFSVDQSGNLSSEISLQGATFRALAWSPIWSDASGGYLAGVGEDTLKTFSVDATGILSSPISSKYAGRTPYALDWSPLGNFIAVACYKNGISSRANNTIQLFSIDPSGNLLTRAADPVPESLCSVATGRAPSSVKFSPNGNVIVVTNQDDNTIQTFTANFLGYQVSLKPDDITFNSDKTTIIGETILAGDALVNGSFDIAGPISGYWHQITGNKEITDTLVPAASTGTTFLTVNFAKARGESALYNKGAIVHLKCIITGEVSGDFKEYVCDFTISISPKIGATPTILNQACFETTSHEAGPIAVSSVASASNTSYDILLNSGAVTIDNQAIALFYEVSSDNVASIS